jgi:hypothetical protein
VFEMMYFLSVESQYSDCKLPNQTVPLTAEKQAFLNKCCSDF